RERRRRLSMRAVAAEFLRLAPPLSAKPLARTRRSLPTRFRLLSSCGSFPLREPILSSYRGPRLSDLHFALVSKPSEFLWRDAYAADEPRNCQRYFLRRH